jgi:hypothetical protein
VIAHALSAPPWVRDRGGRARGRRTRGAHR